LNAREDHLKISQCTFYVWPIDHLMIILKAMLGVHQEIEEVQRSIK